MFTERALGSKNKIRMIDGRQNELVSFFECAISCSKSGCDGRDCFTVQCDDGYANIFAFEFEFEFEYDFEFEFEFGFEFEFELNLKLNFNST